MAERVCPWWVGYFLSCPIRKFIENPNEILSDHVTPGMTVLDIGCAMGFFSLPLARMVGAQGKVVSVDLQQKMINSLIRRARRKGLWDRIEARVCSSNSLDIDDLNQSIDLAIAFHVIHEVPDSSRLIEEVFSTLKTGAKFYIMEPKGHCTPEVFAATEKIAIETGFSVIDKWENKRERAIMLVKEV